MKTTFFKNNVDPVRLTDQQYIRELENAIEAKDKRIQQFMDAMNKVVLGSGPDKKPVSASDLMAVYAQYVEFLAR